MLHCKVINSGKINAIVYIFFFFLPYFVLAEKKYSVIFMAIISIKADSIYLFHCFFSPTIIIAQGGGEAQEGCRRCS